MCSIVYTELRGGVCGCLRGLEFDIKTRKCGCPDAKMEFTDKGECIAVVEEVGVFNVQKLGLLYVILHICRHNCRQYCGINTKNIKIKLNQIKEKLTETSFFDQRAYPQLTFDLIVQEGEMDDETFEKNILQKCKDAIEEVGDGGIFISCQILTLTKLSKNPQATVTLNFPQNSNNSTTVVTTVSSSLQRRSEKSTEDKCKDLDIEQIVAVTISATVKPFGNESEC